MAAIVLQCHGQEKPINRLIDLQLLPYDRVLTAEQTHPFQEVFVPFIRWARKELNRRMGDKYHLLSAEAHITLERSLLKQLCTVCAPTLQQEFLLFRAQRRLEKPLQSLFDQKSVGISVVQYHDFVQQMLVSRLNSIFAKYRLLEELIGKLCDSWVLTTAEFINRLKADLPLIQKTFKCKLEPGQVMAIKADLSDRHSNGRTVLALFFAGGFKLLYKPRRVAVEKAFYNFLSWFNSNGMTLPFKLLTVLDRAAYGWVEYVEPLPCKTEEEVKNYYQRAGMLLALTAILNARDCHYENLIACGEHPILTDLEALLHPDLKPAVKPADASYSTNEWEEVHALKRTGLLPSCRPGALSWSVNASGMGAIGGEITPYRSRKWLFLNTDHMSLHYEFARIPPGKNHPTLHAVRILPGPYIEEILNGFVLLHQVLRKQRHALLSSGSPIQEFGNQVTRFIFRSSRFYAALRSHIFHPDNLKHNTGALNTLKTLEKVLHLTAFCHLQPVVELEKQALLQLDIPRFTISSNSTDWQITENLLISNCFIRSGYDCLIANLQSLNKMNLERQTHWIRKTVAHIR